MAEQATSLKHGDNLFDKTWEGIRRPSLNDKTVSRFLVEPLLKAVGYLLRRAAKTRTRAGGFQGNLT